MTLRSSIVIVVLVLMLSGAGCMKIQKAEVAHYQLGEPQLLSTAPRTGMYSIRWAIHPTAALQRLDGTDVLLLAGEKAGFEINEEGNLVAIGGPNRFAIPSLPEQAKFVVWYHHEREKTQFARELDKAGKVAGQAALIAGAAAIIGAAAVAAADDLHDHHCNHCGTNCRCHPCRCYP